MAMHYWPANRLCMSSQQHLAGGHAADRLCSRISRPAAAAALRHPVVLRHPAASQGRLHLPRQCSGEATAMAVSNHNRHSPSLSTIRPSPSSRSSSATAATVTGATGATPRLLTQQQLSDLKIYLDELSKEQREAVCCRDQQVRVIAGPGSGKTCVITAKVAALIGSGSVPPEQLLVITFTRKAAGELKDRLKNLLGPAVSDRLQPRTFHSTCCAVLREFNTFLPSELQEFMVADTDDVKLIVGRVMKQLNQMAAAKCREAAICEEPGSSSSRQIDEDSDEGETGADSSKVLKADVFRLISCLKNFVHTLHIPGPQMKHRPGWQLVEEVLAAEVPEFVDMNSTTEGQEMLRYLAGVYDSYTDEKKSLGMLDFDDLLHVCLSLIKQHPHIAAELHSRWSHVLVDEGQDINRCQFDLIRQATGPCTSLFMVGDPYQAIYGFRGAMSELLCDTFDQEYPAATTLELVDNYRSKQAIVEASDLVKGQGKLFKPTRCIRGGCGSGVTLQLQRCGNQFQEREVMLNQLKAWHDCGLKWSDMAVLCRTNMAARLAFWKAVEQGVPARLVAGRQLWEKKEVKTVLAVLRCVVHPAAAGDVIIQHLATKDAKVKCNLLDGLGVTPLNQLQAHLNTLPYGNSSSSSSGRMSLGSCLLQDCSPTDMSLRQAEDISQSWESIRAAAYLADGSIDQQKLLDGLQKFAPPWQPPEGFNGVMNKKQKAALAQLRGLVAVAQAAAVLLQPPTEVLMLLLVASGVWGNLRAAAGRYPEARLVGSHNPSGRKSSSNSSSRNHRPAGQKQQQHDADCRLRNLQVLLNMAESCIPLYTASSVSAAGPELLQLFYDYCALLGDEQDANQAVERDEVEFMTMHMSKGKEFPCVVLPHVYDRMERHRHRSQQKNLLYVGMTRAEDQLLVTWPQAILTKDKSGELVRHEIPMDMYLLPVHWALQNRTLPEGVLIED